jgi:hypothetical protein
LQSEIGICCYPQQLAIIFQSKSVKIYTLNILSKRNYTKALTQNKFKFIPTLGVLKHKTRRPYSFRSKLKLWTTLSFSSIMRYYYNRFDQYLTFCMEQVFLQNDCQSSSGVLLVLNKKKWPKKGIRNWAQWFFTVYFNQLVTSNLISANLLFIVNLIH